jgi:hypothetical protein
MNGRRSARFERQSKRCRCGFGTCNVSKILCARSTDAANHVALEDNQQTTVTRRCFAASTLVIGNLTVTVSPTP